MHTVVTKKGKCCPWEFHASAFPNAGGNRLSLHQFSRQKFVVYLLLIPGTRYQEQYSTCSWHMSATAKSRITCQSSWHSKSTCTCSWYVSTVQAQVLCIVHPQGRVYQALGTSKSTSRTLSVITKFCFYWAISPWHHPSPSALQLPRPRAPRNKQPSIPSSPRRPSLHLSGVLPRSVCSMCRLLSTIYCLLHGQVPAHSKQETTSKLGKLYTCCNKVISFQWVRLCLTISLHFSHYVAFCNFV